MKKVWKRAAALALGLVAAMGLSGCGELSNLIRSGFDASGYVQGILDCTYKAAYDQYMKLTDATQEEAEEAYEGGIEAEAQTFMQMCTIDADLVSDETLEGIKDFYRRVYQKSKYEVKDAVKSDSGFFVEAVIEPIDIFQIAWDDMNAFSEQFNERFENGEFDEYTEEAFEEEYAQGMLEVCNSYVDQIGYLEPVSVVVTIFADEDGVYTLSDEDFLRLDTEIISYD